MDLGQKKDWLYAKFWERTGDPSLDWLKSGTLFLTIHGSHAYGLNTDESDVDMAGICIPPKEYFLGFMKSMEQVQFNKPDGAIYSIIKFCRLACENNPNVLELLWIDPKYWVRDDHRFLELRNNRDLFLSSKVRFTYAGYAHAQLKRIKLHKQYLLNPPNHQPTREEFGLPEKRIISSDQLGALNQLQNEGKLDFQAPNFIEYLRRENEYGRAKQEWQQYQNWKATRNPARAELEAKFGYDTKHGAHLVRLLRQCRELLTTGTMLVERPDREELLAIRRGEWAYDDMMAWAEKQDSELDSLYENTVLPKSPKRELIDNLCIKLAEESL